MCVWWMIGSREDIKYWLSRNEHMICSAMLICATSLTWRLPSWNEGRVEIHHVQYWGNIRLHYRVMWHVKVNAIVREVYPLLDTQWTNPYGLGSKKSNGLSISILVSSGYFTWWKSSVQPNDENHKCHNMCIVVMAFIHSVSIWFCDGRLTSMILMMCAKYIGK